MILMVRRFSDVRIYETETATTIERGCGSGGNNLPLILVSVCEADGRNEELHTKN